MTTWTHIGILAALVGAIAYQNRDDVADGLAVAADRIQSLLPKGYRNNNPGCMRYIARAPFRGQTGADMDGIGIYNKISEGYRAMGKQLLAYERRGLRTVRQIIATWAPPNENDTRAYVDDVAKDLMVDADAQVSVSSELARLGRAIAKHENGYALHSVEQIRQWMAT